MAYYMGDYYGRGSFYRGDPGFFSFLGRLAKGAIKLATGFGGGAKAAPAIRELPQIVRSLPGVGGIVRKGGALIKRIPRGVLVAGGAAAAGAAAGAVGGRLLRGGGGGKRRRMNVCNARALRRAIRRSQGFARLAKRVLRFTSPKAPRGRAVFKAKRRRKI